MVNFVSSICILRSILPASLLLGLSACRPAPHIYPKTITPPATRPAGLAPTSSPTPQAILPALTHTPAPAVPDTPWREEIRLSLGVITSAPLYSPDGTRLAVPTSNGVYIYDTSTWGEPVEFGRPGPTCGHPCALAYSPDGRLLAAANGSDIWVWDDQAREPPRSRSLGTDASMYITSLDFSPDGARLAAGYQSASSITTVVFQTGDWQPLYTTPGEAPHFSPDGQTIATTLVIQGASSTALYSSLTGKPLHRWDGRTVSFLPTGELVVEAGSAVRLVDPRSFTARLALNGRAPALAPDGRSLAVYQGEAVHLYSLADGALLSTFDLPPEVAMIEDVESVLISPSGESLAASTVMRLCSTCELSPGPIVLWNSEDGSLVNTLPIPASRAWLSFAPGGKELAVATKDNFKRYSLSTGGLVGGLSTFSDYTGELAFSPDGELLAVGYSELDSFGLRVWELPSLKQPNSFVTFARSTPAMDWWKMAYSPDGRLIALGGLFWQAQTGKNVPVLQQAIDSANPDLAISQAFDPGGQTVALGYPGGQVQVWGLADARLIQTLSSTFSGDVVSLAYSPDGAQLAAAYAYRFADIVQVSPVAQVWQMPSGAPIYRLAANNIFYVAYSPDGQKLATISAADDSYQRNFPFGVVRLWSQAGEPLITYPPADVMRLAFSPDGQLLATGLSNGRVQLWDLAGALIQELDTAQRGVITGLAFSADGNLLAIASAIGVIEIWATLG